jgi:hypothetical protein
MINETKVEKLKELYGKTLNGEFPPREEFSAALNGVLNDLNEEESSYVSTMLYGKTIEVLICIPLLAALIPGDWWLLLLRDLRRAAQQIDKENE